MWLCLCTDAAIKIHIKTKISHLYFPVTQHVKIKSRIDLPITDNCLTKTVLTVQGKLGKSEHFDY